MAWSKIDDGLDGNPKVDALLENDELHGLAAMGLWVLALSKAGKHLTDGDLSPRAVRTIAPENGAELARLLVDAGMWEAQEAGWTIHDYLDYNDSREVVLARREKDAQRKADARAKKGRSVQPSARTSRDVRADAGADGRTDSRRPSALPDPTRPDPTTVSPVGETTDGPPPDVVVVVPPPPAVREEVDKACDTLAAAGLHVHDRTAVERLADEHPKVDIEQAAINCARWLRGGDRKVRHPLKALQPFVTADDAPESRRLKVAAFAEYGEAS